MAAPPSSARAVAAAGDVGDEDQQVLRQQGRACAAVGGEFMIVGTALFIFDS
jgi:hypothetical protein